MVVARALRVDAFAVGVAVGVVTDEVGVEDVGELGGKRGDTAVRADRSPPLVIGRVVPPDAHPLIISDAASADGRVLRCGGHGGVPHGPPSVVCRSPTPPLAGALLQDTPPPRPPSPRPLTQAVAAIAAGRRLTPPPRMSFRPFFRSTVGSGMTQSRPLAGAPVTVELCAASDLWHGQRTRYAQ
jgi:hypothetical protein